MSSTRNRKIPQKTIKQLQQERLGGGIIENSNSSTSNHSVSNSNISNSADSNSIEEKNSCQENIFYKQTPSPININIDTATNLLKILIIAAAIYDFIFKESSKDRALFWLLIIGGLMLNESKTINLRMKKRIELKKSTETMQEEINNITKEIAKKTKYILPHNFALYQINLLIKSIRELLNASPDRQSVKKIEDFLQKNLGEVPHDGSMLTLATEFNVEAVIYEILNKYEKEIIESIKNIKEISNSKPSMDANYYSIDFSYDFDIITCLFDVHNFNLKVNGYSQSYRDNNNLSDLLSPKKLPVENLPKSSTTDARSANKPLPPVSSSLRRFDFKDYEISSEKKDKIKTRGISGLESNGMFRLKAHEEKSEKMPTNKKAAGVITITDENSNPHDYDLYHVEKYKSNQGISCYIFFPEKMTENLASDFDFYIETLKGKVGDYGCSISTNLEPELKKLGCEFKLKPYNADVSNAGKERIAAVQIGKSVDNKTLIYVACIDFVKGSKPNDRLDDNLMQQTKKGQLEISDNCTISEINIAGEIIDITNDRGLRLAA